MKRSDKLVLGFLVLGALPVLLVEAPPRGFGILVALWFLSGAYVCVSVLFRASFRESFLTRIAGFGERDEREEVVTAKAARSVFLVTLGCLIAAGLFGMIRFNVYECTRWKGDHVPPLTQVGKYQLRRGEIEKRSFVMWPSLGIPRHYDAAPDYTEKEEGSTQYYYEGGTLFEPEVSRTFFALAAIQVLLFHLFARRVKA